MEFLGWEIIFTTDNIMGYKTEASGSLWFVNSNAKTYQNYDDIGLNHIAIRVDTKNDVDRISKYIQDKNISLLFNTPRHRKEFVETESETYYQVMFETPDKILFEIVYIGLKVH